jgi:hypothetical protein
MSKIRHFNKVIIFVCAFFLLTFWRAYGFEDGFGSAKKSEGAHFTVYLAPALDAQFLAQELNIGPSENIFMGSAQSSSNASGSDLPGMLDALFSQICDYLDMQLYSFKGTIKICRDFEHLIGIYERLFNSRDLNTSSFYVYALNTIYISPENFKREVLGHEIAHAIISHYFVVQPPMKAAEVLAGYVEYQLRKYKR